MQLACTPASPQMYGTALLLVLLPILQILTKHSASGCGAEAEGGDPDGGVKRVLVTGAAGFIGYHSAQHLRSVSAGRPVVIGVDNFNSYYDITLKRDRAAHLIALGVTLHYASVCDVTYMRHLFAAHRFTHVVHCAGEAGVRHSGEAPHAFVEANIGCFAELLDILKEYRGVHLVYASSSSVYGPASPVPFLEMHTQRYPGNMYALTKMTNELLASHYCEAHQQLAVGLRFFTVYGPWGRPDMAVYRFTKSIHNKEKVFLSVNPGPIHQPILRDFTYVDDIIKGIVSAMEYCPSVCGEVYNLGNGNPVSLEEVIRHLEGELGLKADVEVVPLSPAELPVTHADISLSQQVLHFSPRVSVEEGLHLFVGWFKDYTYNRSSPRKEQERNRRKAEEILREIFSNSSGLREKLEEKATAVMNRAYDQRLKGLRQKYYEFAKEHGIAVPTLEKKGFVKYEGVEATGHEIMFAPRMAGDVKLLSKTCTETEVCVAFTLSGHFYSELDSKDKWTRGDNEDSVVFVADVNMCESDLHRCPEHSFCIHNGPAAYHCQCEDGRATKKCVLLYSPEVVSELEARAEEDDFINGVDRSAMRKGKEFVFFQGKDSSGGDYLLVPVDGEGAVERLKEVCWQLRGCLGFNTNGVLKSSLKSPLQWYSWTELPQQGLYVLDVDYCQLNEELCPPHSTCRRHSHSYYHCTCEDGWLMDRSLELCVQQGDEEDSAAAGRASVAGTVHILMSVDQHYWVGLVSAMNSIMTHTPSPEDIQFHLVVSGVPEAELVGYLRCYSFVKQEQMEVVQMDTSWVRDDIRVYTDSQVVGNLASLGNFARFYFHKLFPGLKKAIYLDSDVVVQHDIHDFWSKLQTSNKIVTAVKRNTPSYGDMFASEAKKLFKQRYGYIFGNQDPTFNAGVFGINLELWHERAMTPEIEYWMQEHRLHPLWRYGTQPLMLIALHGQWAELDTRWNLDGLGWNSWISKEQLQGAFLLHWSGKGKPWLEEGLYQRYWQPHRPHQCSGHGNCIATGGKFKYTCVCYHGYSGSLCEQMER